MYDDIKLTSHTFMKLNCIAVDFEGENEIFISQPLLIMDTHHIVIHKF